MTSTGSRGAARMVSVLFCLLVGVLAGRHVVETVPQAVAVPLKGGAVLSAPDQGLVAVASRAPVPAQEALLDFGAITPVTVSALLMLVWTAALAVGRGRLELDALGVRCRRRGPPTLRAI
jgi:hypothetical protein